MNDRLKLPCEMTDVPATANYSGMLSGSKEIGARAASETS